MMVRGVFFAWVTLTLCAFRAGAQQSVLTVNDVVQLALERNRNYLAFRERVAETRALVRQSGVRPTPSIEVEGATGGPLGSPGEEDYSAGYFHTIEPFGKRTKRIRVAEKSVALAEAELDEDRRQLAQKVRAHYAEAVAAQLKLAVLGRLMELYRGNYRLTEARVRDGDAAPLEQQLLLTDLNRAEAQQATFAARSASALLELKQAVGLGPSEALHLTSEFEPAADTPPLADLQKRALESRPDLRTLRILEEQGDAEVELARAEGRPDLTASVRYSLRNTRFEAFGLNAAGAAVPLRERNNILSFGLAIPLFTARRAQGNVEAAVSRHAAARLRREYLETTIPIEVEAAYQRWQGAQRSLSIFQSGVVGQSEKNLEVIREAYRLGQLRITDVLNEQRRLIDTELAFIDAQFDQTQAVTDLEKTVGGKLR